MQISPLKNTNFEKPSRNLSNRTKVKILGKKFFGQLSKKIWFHVCSVTAEMFEHRNSGENRRKRSELFFENLRRAYKDLIQVKKKFKIISCLCTFNIHCIAGAGLPIHMIGEVSWESKRRRAWAPQYSILSGQGTANRLTQ